MIKNEKQYKIAKSWLKRFEQSRKELDELPKTKKQPWLREAQKGSLTAQIEQLRAEIHEYEGLKTGRIKVTLPSVEAIMELPTLLIRRRIANGWTLEKLAETVGIHWQQIQRYEQNEYASASLRVLLKITQALTKHGEPKKHSVSSPGALRKKQSAPKMAARRTRSN